jgi:hypothetical protein
MTQSTLHLAGKEIYIFLSVKNYTRRNKMKKFTSLLVMVAIVLMVSFTFLQSSVVSADPSLGELDGIASDPSLGELDGIASDPSLGELDGITSDPSLGELDGITSDPSLGELDGIMSDPSLGELD